MMSDDPGASVVLTVSSIRYSPGDAGVTVSDVAVASVGVLTETVASVVANNGSQLASSGTTTACSRSIVAVAAIASRSWTWIVTGSLPPSNMYTCCQGPGCATSTDSVPPSPRSIPSTR